MEHLITGALFMATIMSGVFTHQCVCDVESLDMAPGSVDDQFLSCADRMMENVTSAGGILMDELNADGSFRQSWLSAEKCNVTAPDLTWYHRMALALYTGQNITFPLTFDTDTKALGPDALVYKRYFPYKSLHFLLTHAMQLLGSREEEKCRTVHGWSREERLQADMGSEVRLGQFFLASTKFVQAYDLTIRTCHGIPVPPSSCHLKQGDVLIPPFEKFQVVAVKKLDWGKKHFYLESTGTKSSLNCAFYSGQVHPHHAPRPRHAPVHETPLYNNPNKKPQHT